MTRLDWEKDKRRRRPKGKGTQQEVKGVHPNSMAARKWGRTSWVRYKRQD